MWKTFSRMKIKHCKGTQKLFLGMASYSAFAGCSSTYSPFLNKKRLRWTSLTNGAELSDEKTPHLQSILSDHSDLAVCYAMKEELCCLFELADPHAIYAGWKRWFDAAVSGIPALVKFAELKSPRLDGLVAHAFCPISTGKLVGFNNKIKVANRIGYGYSDDAYFFSLIRYLALPSIRSAVPKFP